MAEPGLPDMSWLLSQAHNRWLQPNEIAQILRNQMLPIRDKPPHLPCSGSVFLYDRRATRQYRNDGHKWEMRRDGKAINEGHMKLKVGNCFVLDCYYARGAQNSNFQRRCYSLREPLDLWQIVFVHYLDVKMTCGSSTTALPAVPLEPLYEKRTQGANKKRNLKSSCSPFDCQNEQPAKRVAQMNLANVSFSSENVHGNISRPLAVPEPSLDEEQADSQNLVIAALECQEAFENDETPHLGGSPHFTSVPVTMGLPGTENSDSSRLSALNEMGKIDYEQTSAFLSDLDSVHPAGVSCGFDDYEFGQIEIVGLRNNPSSSFLGEVSRPLSYEFATASAFCEERSAFLSDLGPLNRAGVSCGFNDYEFGHIETVGLRNNPSTSFLGEVSSPLSYDIATIATTSVSREEDHSPYAHTGCQTEELDNLPKTILLEFATWYAKTRWTKVSGVLKLFSVRKVVAVKGVFVKVCS